MNDRISQSNIETNESPTRKDLQKLQTETLYTHELSNNIDLSPPDTETLNTISKIINALLDKEWCDEHIKNKTMSEITSEIIDASGTNIIHILFSLNIPQDWSYRELSWYHKMHLLALYNATTQWAIRHNPNTYAKWVWESVNPKVKNNANHIKDSYKRALINLTNDLNNHFVKEQNGDISQSLTSIGITGLEQEHFVSYLQDLESNLQATQPQQWWKWSRFVAGTLLWLAAWVFGYKKYKDFITPDIQRWLPIWEVFMDRPETLAKLSTASQKFTQSGTRTDSYFTPENDGSITSALKNAANTLQSRTISMNMEWDVEVSYDFDNYKMFYDGERVTIHIANPTFRVANTNTYIQDRNSERIETKALDNTEQELTAELKQKAIDKAKSLWEVEKLSQEELARVIYNLLSIVEPSLQWVDIVIDGNESQKKTFDTRRLKD